MRLPFAATGFLTASCTGLLLLGTPAILFYLVPQASKQLVEVYRAQTAMAYEQTRATKTDGDGVAVPWQWVIALDAGLRVQDLKNVTADEIRKLIWSDFIARRDWDVCEPPPPPKAPAPMSAPAPGAELPKPAEPKCEHHVSFQLVSLATAMSRRGLDADTMQWVTTMSGNADWLITPP